MKTILAALALWVVVGCSSSFREVQEVDMVRAELVKIDTIWRHPERVKQLTWKDSDDIHYVSFVSIHNENYDIGSSMYVMRKR
jgi:hypothetical protein